MTSVLDDVPNVLVALLQARFGPLLPLDVEDRRGVATIISNLTDTILCLQKQNVELQHNLGLDQSMDASNSPEGVPVPSSHTHDVSTVEDSASCLDMLDSYNERVRDVACSLIQKVLLRGAEHHIAVPHMWDETVYSDDEASTADELIIDPSIDTVANREPAKREQPSKLRLEWACRQVLSVDRRWISITISPCYWHIVKSHGCGTSYSVGSPTPGQIISLAEDIIAHLVPMDITQSLVSHA